jgi:nitrile hydratase accessory protein
MAAPTNSSISEMEGAAALPRKNGELVFEAPWEGRAFGLAVALNESGHYEWRAFRNQLVAQIADADANGAESSYYERWLASLEELLVAQGAVTRAELDARTREYGSGERDDDND